MATKTAEKKQEYTMTDIFALWKKEGKKGTPYFTGKSKEGINLRGFFNTNKKNPKEPDLRVYSINGEGELSKEPIISMWCNVSKNGKKFLTGKLGDKRVVGFINEKTEGNRPYVTCYYSEDRQIKADIPETAEEPKTQKEPF